MEEEQTPEDERPIVRRLALAGVLTMVGLGAVAMLVLAAAAVVFR